MIPILDYEVDEFSDVACFMEGSIHIIDREAIEYCSSVRNEKLEHTCGFLRCRTTNG